MKLHGTIQVRGQDKSYPRIVNNDGWVVLLYEPNAGVTLVGAMVGRNHERLNEDGFDNFHGTIIISTEEL